MAHLISEAVRWGGDDRNAEAPRFSSNSGTAGGIYFTATADCPTVCRNAHDSIMKVRTCNRRTLLQPCSLEGYDVQIDPYIGCGHACCYCYALNQAETDWSREILSHPDIVGQLREELTAAQPIYLGWNSDPYQPAEAVHCQTRRVLKLLAEKGCPVCILTKSSLVTRDVDLLSAMPGSTVGISIAFPDEGARTLFEPDAPPTGERLEALERMKEAGLETYVLICPVMPFITDVEPLIDLATPHADSIWLYPLKMQSASDRNWQNLLEVLRRDFPDLVESYRRIAFDPDDPYWSNLRQNLQRIKQERPLDLRIKL